MPTLKPEEWREVKPWLDQALAMPEEERTALLASLRDSKPSLAALLQSLLAEHHVLADEQFLEHSPVPLAREPELMGQSIGAYTLESLLGQGGMGSVWLARRSDGHFERRAAIKFLNVALVGHAGEGRFKREGKMLAQLAHPHIAGLLDAGVSPSGQPFLLLEYVDGQHIDLYCDQRKLAVEARIQLFLDVLAAVAHAHAHLIIHRDIKPSNVLIATDGQVKLLDFGIAKLLDEEGRAGGATLLTQEAGSALTPEYAAPEQVTDDPVTTATDVYGLGVLLYVLLTGQHPAGPGRHSTADLVKAIVETEPPPPSDAVMRDGTEAEALDTRAAARSCTPDRLRRLLRGDLDTIILKALKKDPLERYASATAFADDLVRYLHNEPIAVRPDTLAYRAGKFVRRNPTTVALASLALLATLAGVTGTLLQAHAARKQRDLAFSERDRNGRITAFMTKMFKVSDPSEARGNSITAREILDNASKEIAADHAIDPETQAKLIDLMGQVYLSLGLYARAESLLRQAVDIRRRVLGPENPDTLSSIMNLGKTLEEEQSYPEAENLFRDALAIQRRVLGPEHPDTLSSMNGLAGSLDGLGRTADAEKLYRDTLEIRRRSLGEEHPDTLASMDNMAWILMKENHLPDAEKVQRDSLDIEKRVEGMDHPDTLSAMNRLARILSLEARYPEAEKLQRDALDIQRRVMGPEHQYTLRSMLNLIDILEKEGHYAEAEKVARERLAIYKHLVGPEHLYTLHSMEFLLGTLSGQGRYSEAEKLARELHAIELRVLGPEHPDTASSTYDIACLAVLQGQRTRALSLLREAVDHGLPPSAALAMEKDDDLKSLRGDPRFAALVAYAKKRATAAPKPS